MWGEKKRWYSLLQHQHTHIHEHTEVQSQTYERAAFHTVIHQAEPVKEEMK